METFGSFAYEVKWTYFLRIYDICFSNMKKNDAFLKSLKIVTDTVTYLIL